MPGHRDHRQFNIAPNGVPIFYGDFAGETGARRPASQDVSLTSQGLAPPPPMRHIANGGGGTTTTTSTGSRFPTSVYDTLNAITRPNSAASASSVAPNGNRGVGIGGGTGNVQFLTTGGGVGGGVNSDTHYPNRLPPHHTILIDQASFPKWKFDNVTFSHLFPFSPA